MLQSVIFLPRHATSWSKMLLLAKIVNASGQFRPLFVLAHQNVLGYANECERLGFEYVTVPSAAVDPMSAPKALRVWRHLRRQYREFRALLQKVAPVAVIAPGDRELWPVPSMLRAARDAGVPVINAAYGVAVSGGLARSRMSDPAFRVQRKDRGPLVNYLAAWLFPRQVRATRFGRMLFSPGWLTLTLAAAGMLPENPWVQGGGNSDHLLVDGGKSARDAIAQGVPKAKIAPIGDPALDALHANWQRRAELRRRLNKEFGFGGARKLVIIAIPIYAEHKLTDWSTHMAGLNKSLAALTAANVDVLASLHPKSNLETYRAMFEAFRVKVSHEPLRDILPAADIFVCGGSSTLFWASCCGIPTINLDYAGVASVGTEPREGLVVARTGADASRALARWLDSDQSYERAVSAQIEEFKTQVLFDGRSTARLLALLASFPPSTCAASHKNKKAVGHSRARKVKLRR